MPAAVQTPRNRDRAPPAKKPRLAQSPTTARPHGLKAMLNGSSAKPVATTNGRQRMRVQSELTTPLLLWQGPGDVDVIEISSAEERKRAGAGAGMHPAANGAADDDQRRQKSEDITFGDRLRAEGPEPVHESRVISVEDAFDANPERTVAAQKSRPLAPPNANSLGTVLTQALRTNDKELLDSCLQVVDVESVYATVERLPSPLVGTLLQRLAERLHRSPGRAGMLMAWVQWSLAAHGGYLASQPQIVKQLTALNKVLKERSSGLMPLMSLKGRLDMLQAQLDLRKRNQAANDDADEALVYVEGQDDYVSDDESVDGTTAPQKRLRQDVDEDDDNSSEDMGLNVEMDDVSDEGSEGSDEDLIDDEAEETDDDEGEDMSDPMSEDLDAGASESEDESKPERRSTAARAGLKSRR
ncbi:U3 small nucleolar RNA-associated protein 5 [Pyrenophora tritici-repentis Pt-1C-BFP]|uniref:U3 small nucleolar RNA-associated protein 5 n=1 Tax=Pyrenophora tritici-repentis (strain Pt-1C-BFP) TaxID=426418 RepID=B2W667_PYRTR|nr:U3 small nucleolar RNA-associated protein 5 [Pyrenophora tritici-repentis Pt-1C-BFP]EDU48225.1 U3 small nucleolar RNA-associated protein 5 [Pyrenophora tritici-repentis Pt-1C-BFP]